jgi:hypothetical protein
VMSTHLRGSLSAPMSTNRRRPSYALARRIHVTSPSAPTLLVLHPGIRTTPRGLVHLHRVRRNSGPPPPPSHTPSPIQQRTDGFESMSRRRGRGKIA